MFVSSSLVSLVLLSLSLPSSALEARTPSLITVPLTPHFDLNALKDLVRNDFTRIQKKYFKKLSNLNNRYFIDEGVANTAIGYTAVIGVGNPLSTYQVIVDTGSSNLWIGAKKKYNATNTSVKTADKIHVEYGSGSFTGAEWLDQITITQELVLANQSIGVADNATGLSYDGILGIGPVDLTVGTLSPHKNASIPTVTDNAYSQGFVSSDQIGVFFEPYSQSQSGELTWGGANSRNYVGELIYAPVTSKKPAGNYWGVDSTITYGTTKLLASAGIIDTGTTLVQLATDAFNVYRNATGAVLDSDTGLLRINQTQFDNLKSLFFEISGVPFELTPNAQLWPRSMNTQIGGSSDYLYLIVADSGSPSGSGLDFIAGYTFLERFYTVYDTSNKRIGFAKTRYTDVTTN